MWNSCLLQRIIVFSAVFVTFESACIYQTARDDRYGVITISYNERYVDECRIIDAGPDCIVHAFTNLTISYEMGCNDTVVLRSNDYNRALTEQISWNNKFLFPWILLLYLQDGPIIGNFNGGEDMIDVYSSGRQMYAFFTRDSPCIDYDIIIYTEALSSGSHSLSCRQSYSDVKKETNNNNAAIAAFPLSWIAFGMVVLIWCKCSERHKRCCCNRGSTSNVRFVNSNQHTNNITTIPVAQPPQQDVLQLPSYSESIAQLTPPPQPPSLGASKPCNFDSNMNKSSQQDVLQLPSYSEAIAQLTPPPQYMDLYAD